MVSGSEIFPTIPPFAPLLIPLMAPSVHALLLTFPGQGHVNPLVQLASNLVSRGCCVTLVDTPRSHSSVLLAAQRDHKAFADLSEKDASSKPKGAFVKPGIHCLTIPDGLSDSFKLDMSSARLKEMLDALKQQEGVLKDYIESLKGSDCPISCIIIDVFLTSALDLAASVGLPGVLCLSTNAINSLLWASIRTPEATECDDLVELRNSSISKDRFLALSVFPNDPTIDEIRKNTRDAICKASQVLINSVRELENFLNLPEFLAAKMRFVGPLLPAEVLKTETSGDAREPKTSVFQEKLEYVDWLDMQVDRSVVFIAFGSFIHLPPSQIGELVAGIEESEVKFLWAARPDKEGKTYLPEGFEERTKRNGRVIPWADQLGVLMHPATAGFLTHCGWNSVLESISLGVPMLCLPAFADQPINRELIVEAWKVGLPLHNTEEVISKASVKSALRELTDGIQGKAIRQSANLWKESVTQAISEGGSSYEALSAFISQVNNS